MRIDLLWNGETLPLDLDDGVITVGGSAQDDIFVEGLPHGLLSLTLEAGQVTVVAQRSVRVGDTLFPARVPRLLVEGETLKLPNDVELRRVVDAKRRDSRRQMATAFVAQELLSGAVAPQDTRAPTLTCVVGLDRGTVYPLPFEENVIGRAPDAPIRIRDRSVSRQHALLVREGRRYLLRIIETSMNGVYVNGLLLKKDQVLKTGDVIEVGATILRFDANERAPGEETSVQPALKLEARPVEVPRAAEPARGLHVGLLRDVALDTWLMSGGAALAVLGLLLAALAR